MLSFPDRSVRFRNVEFKEPDIFVRRDIELNVVAGSDLDRLRTVDRLQQQLFYESRDTAITDYAQMQSFLGSRTCTAGASDVQKEAAISVLDWIGGDPATDRGSSWRTISEIKTPIVFWHSMIFPFTSPSARCVLPWVQIPSLS